MLPVASQAQLTKDLTPGVRFGSDIVGTMPGISVRKQIEEFRTAELIVGLVSGGLKITAIGAQHEENLADEEGLSWYAGVGSHVYLLSSSTLFGFDGQIGVEYDIPETKLTAAVEYKPTYELDGGFYWGSGGMTIRYNLNP